MIPIGYSRKSIGRFLAVAICVGAGVLLVLFIDSGATVSDMKYFGIVASVNSPLTGKEILVTSEAYSRNVNSFISDGFVDVHYSSDGEYWIELV